MCCMFKVLWSWYGTLNECHLTCDGAGQVTNIKFEIYTYSTRQSINRVGPPVDSDLTGKLVVAEAPCSFKAATSHALAAALS